MASRAQGLCARLALSLLLLTAAANAQPEACAAAEAEAAGRSPPPAAAAGWQHALVGEPPAGPRIIDISVALDAATPKFSSPDGLGQEFRVLETSQAKGDAYTSSLLRLGAHTGALRCGWALALPVGRQQQEGAHCMVHANEHVALVLTCKPLQMQAPMWTARGTLSLRRTQPGQAWIGWTCMP